MESDELGDEVDGNVERFLWERDLRRDEHRDIVDVAGLTRR